MPPRLMIVEDDEPLIELLRYNFEAAGYAVETVRHGDEAEARLRESVPDLLILDWMLPGLSGIELCRRLRQKPGTQSLPLIMLTARSEEADRVRGFETGADDYVVKPFGPKELLARVEAVLRRSAERPRAAGPVELRGMTVDFERREARFADGRRADLPEREADLLRYLAANPGRAVSREELLSRVWGIDAANLETRAVDMLVARLRERLGDPGAVLTVRGKGYMLARPEDEA